jgi:hypothetical protein
MNSKYDELVKQSAKGLVELANYAGIKWDEIYLMYQRDELQTGGTQTYRNGRELKFINFEFDDKKAEEIESNIWSTLGKLFDFISDINGKSPSSCVVNVTSDYNFKIKFSYGESKGMSIRLLDLGKPQSFYDLAVVDIPQSIKKAQKNGS